MTTTRPVLALVAFLVCAHPAFAQTGAASTIDRKAAPENWLDVHLLFDGKPLLSKKDADFSCFDYGRDKWINCRIEPSDGIQTYLMRRPPPGRYRMYVRLDENEDNPDSYPGDYEINQVFEIADGVYRPLYVDLARVIHLRSPRDNGRSIEGAFGACERDADYTVPFLSLDRTVPIEFGWDPVADEVAYSVSIIRARCDPYERLETIVTSETSGTSIRLELPPNAAGEHYQFMVDANRNGHPLGMLLIHDAGTHGWDYRFRIALEEPSPRIAVIASLGAVFVFFLVAMAFMIRTGNRSLATASLVVVVVSGWLGYQAYASYRDDHLEAQRRLLEVEETAAELQESLNRLFVEEWTARVPRPEWWDEVTPPDYEIDNVGELFSAWQSDFGKGETRWLRERQFFKGAYQAVVEHPGDQDLTSTAIDLMAYIGRDYPYRRQMLEFGVKHFFDFDRRTDNCAGCLEGDLANSLVEALAEELIRAREYDAAIDLVERFRSARRNEVSDYAWAETITVLGDAYWKSGRREAAVEAMAREEGISGDHPYVARLKERLSRYRVEIRNEEVVPLRPEGS